MAKKLKAKKGKKGFWGKFFAVVGIVLLVVVTLGLGLNAYYNLKYDKVKASDYEVGAISTVDGADAESNTSIRLKDGVTVNGLKVDINEEDDTIETRVYFYDAENNFISCTEVLEADFVASKVTEENVDGNVPENAATARFVITPTADEDGVVSEDEVAGYAKEVKITFNR